MEKCKLGLNRPVIISKGYGWDSYCKCDPCSQIVSEGTNYLLSNGEIVYISNLGTDEDKANAVLIESLRTATDCERIDYARIVCNRVFHGDTTTIVKGRKMVGEKKIIVGESTYEIAGTYGHGKVYYWLFNDGTRCNKANCDIHGKYTELSDLDIVLGCSGDF